MSLSLFVGNLKLRGWTGLHCRNVHTKFRENRATDSKAQSDTHTDTDSTVMS